MILHRTQALLLRQRTQLINAVRGHLAEFGLVARRGARNIRELAELVRDTEADKLPDAARAMLVLLLEQIREAQLRVRNTEQALEAWAKQSHACRQLLVIPGVGIMSATALVLAMDDPSASDPVVTSWPGSGLYHAKVRAANVRFSAGSASMVTAMSACY